MRKLLYLFIAFLLPLAASADDSGTCGQNVTWSYETATKTLTISGSGAMWNYTSSDNTPWFNYRSAIKKINIENGVTNIGNFAFYQCSITSANIPNSVTSIGNYAFYQCLMTSINIPNSVTSLGNHSFWNCYNLRSITIPNSVTSIGSNAFYSCGNLVSVTMGNSVTNIGSYAFQYCSSLTSINIPNSVTSIGSNAFQYCSKLVSASIGNSVMSIGDNAFHSCSSLASVTIGMSLSSIGEKVFYRCSSLESIQVDEANTSLDSRDNCNAIIRTSNNTLIVGCKNTTIPNSVTSIGTYAFSGCTFLTSIDIPQSLTIIRSYAFSECDNLTSVTMENPTPISIYSNSFPTRSNITLYVPGGSRDAYLAADYWNGFRDIIEYSVGIQFADPTVKSICIANWDKDGDGELTEEEAKIVKSLGTYFKGTEIKSFNELKYFTALTSIPSRAFDSCSQLEAITLPNSIKKIDSYAFQSCSSLNAIEIPGSVTDILYAAFNNCSSLKVIEIPASVTNIYVNGVFTNCSSLEKFKVVSGNTRYTAEDGVLFNISKTILVAFPGGKAGEYIVPDGVTTLRQYAFCGAGKLTNCQLPETLTAIPYGAFARCSSLTYVNIPASVQSIDQYAFTQCPKLAMMKVGWKTPLAEPNITGNVFQNTQTENISLYVPRGSKNDYMVTPIWKDFKEIIEYGDIDIEIINFADQVTKRICVANWDADGDEELSVDEAAAVTSLGTVFTQSQISSFDELKFFKGLSSIGEGAFKGSTVKSLTIPENVSLLGKEAFLNCKSLVSLHIPAKVSVIGQNALSGCTSMTSITVDDGNSSFCDMDGVLFSKDKKTLCQFPAAKTSRYYVPEGTEVIGRDAFHQAIATYINLPSTLKELANGAFGCSKIKELNMPEGLRIIDDLVFDGCSALKAIHIPSSVTSIGQNMCSNCNSISDVFCYMENPFAINDNSFSTIVYANATLHIPAIARQIYSTLDGWKNFDKMKILEEGDIYYKIDKTDIIPGETAAITFYYDAAEDAIFRGFMVEFVLPEGFTRGVVDGKEGKLGPELAAHNPEMELKTSLRYDHGEANPPTCCYMGFQMGTDDMPTGPGIELFTFYVQCDENVAEGEYSFTTTHNELADMKRGQSLHCTPKTHTLIVPPSPKPYLAISEDGKTATFYYDNQKDERPGMVFDLDGYEGLGADTAAVVTKVVFDSSFAESRPTSTYKWFYWMNNLETIEGMEYLNTSEVTTTRAMFSGCSKLGSIDLSHFNTSKVTSIRNMFYGCSSLTSLDLTKFNTSNVTSMYGTFSGCSGLTSLDVRNFDTSNVTTMEFMFNKCSKLASLDVSGFNTSKVESMRSMFNSCTNLASLDVSGFNTSNVTTMYYMFYKCTKLTSLDLSGFNTSKVTTMEAMFSFCNALTTIDVSSFNTSKVTSMRCMFNECTSLKTLDLSNFDTSIATNTSAMFDNDHSLENLIISSTMGNLNENAFNGVGKQANPCLITAPEGFDFGDVNIYGTFQWKAGWFKLSNIDYSSCTLAANAVSLSSGGSANLVLSLDNGDEKVSAFQFDLILPEGVTLAENGSGFAFTLADRCGGMRVRVVENQERHYSLMAFFLDYDKFIEGTSGPIVTLTLKAEEGLSEGDLEGVVGNIVLTNLDYDVLKVAPVAFPITISVHPMGDVNHDGDVNVADVMMTVGVILGQTVTGFHFENADVNGDGSLNITDVMGIVDIVLYHINSAPALSTSDCIAAVSTTNGVDIRLENASRYTALEMTVELPQGATLTRASLCKSTGHSVETRNLGGGLHRVVVYSLSGEPLSEGDALLRLDVMGGSCVKISDVVLTNAFFESLSPQEATGVIDIAGETNDSPIYNIQGMKVNQPGKGVYIKDNKKVIVK